MKVTMIINPSSGLQNSQKDLDTIYKELKKHHAVSRFYTKKKHDAKFHAIDAIKNNHDLIIACGGDGTVNEIAEAVGQLGYSIPVAIYPSGTSNDLANHFKISKRPRKFLKMIDQFKVKEIDLGQLNDHYFINVAALGNIAGIADSTDDERKARIGFLAYFLEAVAKLPDLLEPRKISLYNDTVKYNVESFLVLVANSKRVGGFNGLIPKADTSDGKFDVLVFKKAELKETAELLIKIPLSSHVDNDNVLYFQTDELYMEPEGEDFVLNLDGDNIRTDLPIKIKLHEGLFKVLVNESEEV